MRPLRQGDMPVRAKWTADPELSSLMGGATAHKIPQARADEEIRRNRGWLERRRKCGVGPYAVEVNARYIGDIDFGIYPHEKKADLTVFLGDRREWGKGYGTEAVELIINELFSDRRIDFIEVDVAPQNDRAFCFWNKLGFTQNRVDDRGTRFMRRFRHSRRMKVALASSRVVPNNIEENFMTIADMAKKSAQADPDVICFPEGAFGFEVDDYRVAVSTAIEIPGEMTERIAALARGYNLYIAIGVLERELSKLYDSALLFNDVGELVLKYRRINPQWRDRAAPKDKYCEGLEFRTISTPYGKVGLAICGDTGDPAVVRLIRETRPHFLINPRNANFDDYSYDQERWDKEKVWACSQAIDIETTIFSVNAYSKPQEGGAYGGSMVVSSRGDILLESKIGKPSILIYQGPSFSEDATTATEGPENVQGPLSREEQVP